MLRYNTDNWRVKKVRARRNVIKAMEKLLLQGFLESVGGSGGLYKLVLLQDALDPAGLLTGPLLLALYRFMVVVAILFKFFCGDLI